MIIDGRPIGLQHRPYIIAELSANHGGDLDRAKRIIRLAAANGADAIKFQAYTADEMTLASDKPDFVIQTESPWKGERLHDLYQRAATPYEWFPELFAVAKECKITPFASPFGLAGVELLDRLDTPAFKIASFEAVDLELIAACARTGKPVIVSTGLCKLEEIEDVVRTFREAGGRDLVLLRCNSAYPADPREANLATISDMISRFGVPVGYSDHTTTPLQAAVAVGLGACIVEKHLIDSREPETPDSLFSCLPDQLAELVALCRGAWEARGTVSYGPQTRERGSLVFRRSLYAVQPIAAGESFTRTNVRSIRPGYGMAPRDLPRVLKARARRPIEAGEPLSADLLDEN